MKLLSGLLGHYQQLFKEKQLNIGLIVAVIKKETNIELVSNELRLKDGVLFIKTKPKYKLEIILKKVVLLEQFKDKNLKIIDLK
jgi:hypothetical protein